MKRTIFLLLAACLCISCSSAGNGTEPQERQEHIKRTALVYMAADNNLYKQAQRDIEEMLAAATPSECNLRIHITIIPKNY